MNTEKHDDWIKAEQAVRAIEVEIATIEKALSEKKEELAKANAAAVVAGCEAAKEKHEAGFAAIYDLDGNLRAVDRCRRKKGGEEPAYQFRVSERILKV